MTNAEALGYAMFKGGEVLADIAAHMAATNSGALGLGECVVKYCRRIHPDYDPLDSKFDDLTSVITGCLGAVVLAIHTERRRDVQD